MNTTKSPGLLAALASWFAVAPANAQTPPAARVPTRDEVVALSPFEVNTSRDTSYGALNSTSISAFNMPLLKTPVAADIFTEEFMRDVATTNLEDLIAGYGAGVGLLVAAPHNDANMNQPGDFVDRGTIGSRAVSGSKPRRNGFFAGGTTVTATDTFDIERAETLKGANGLLYGPSGAGGVVNVTSKQARFGSEARPNRSTEVSLRTDQYGSKRWLLDSNFGVKNVAFRFVYLNDETKSRRLFVGSSTEGFFGAFAARLPFNTTLRLSGRRTDSTMMTSSPTADLGFTNATRDPRHNFSLAYLLATGKAGEQDPVTGARYPGGAVANGRLDWNNADSWGGWTGWEDYDGENLTLTVDTVWSKWLATSLGAMYDLATRWGVSRGGVLGLSAPRALDSANPYDDWAASATYQLVKDFDLNSGRRIGYRAHAIITNELFRDRAKSQTVLGYDLNFAPALRGGGAVAYRYYEADADFRVYNADHPRPASQGNPAEADVLGRIAMPTVFWPVGGGPVKRPYFKPWTARVTVAGKNYVLDQMNPRNPAWVTPLNPLGLASLTPGYASLSGNNLGHNAEFTKNWGLYGANYTRWLDDRLTTLLGYRFSSVFTRNANTSLVGTEGWTDTKRHTASYNGGFTYRLKPWLYGYYNGGKTFDPPTRNPDFYGTPPGDTLGVSHEIGFKYEPADARISGSIAYYRVNSKNEPCAYGQYTDLVNPVGINGAFNQPTRNSYVYLDKEGRGLEVILTAAPTRNWLARLGFTQQNGTFRSSSTYGLLWNDEFFYDKATGGVKYSDGTPFLVPTDTAGIAQVNRTSALREPVVGAANAQLTIGMMSDPANPYYAYGQGAVTQANGRITNNSTVFRALRWFQLPSGGQMVQARTLRTGLPVSAIPYAYSDPAGLQGSVTPAAAGEPTVGQPKYRLVFTNTYRVTEGRLRGLAAGVTARWDIDRRAFYYNEPDGKGASIHKLFNESNVNPQVNPFCSYSRKLGARYVFRTQLNINNLFNRYKVEIRPNATNGYTIENGLTATFVGQPRQYVWTNAVSF